MRIQWGQALFLAGLLSAGQLAQAEPDDRQWLRFFEQIESYSAFFEQEVFSAEGTRLSVAQGDMLLLRPRYLRWNYRTPDTLILVSDGEHFWSYDPLLEQATVTPLAEAVRATPLALLLSSEYPEEVFAVESVEHRHGIDWTSLRLREAHESDMEFLLGWRADTLVRLHFIDQFGQEVRIGFEQIQLNPPLQPDAFTWRPPSGTDILGTPPP